LFSSDKPRSQVMLEHRIASDEALRQRLHRAREKYMGRMVAITTEAERELLQGGRATIEDWERIVLHRATISSTIQGMATVQRRLALLNRTAKLRNRAQQQGAE
jgi:hypothetical protein